MFFRTPNSATKTYEQLSDVLTELVLEQSCFDLYVTQFQKMYS